jgi:aspartate/methionine/tyrosine aminotransferase
MEQLPPYLFGMINRMKMERRRKGDDVIDLGMGNPIDPAPEAVTQKLCEVAQDPKSHRYPVADGLAHLRREFAMQLMQEANVAVAPGIGFGEEGENYLRLAMVENEHRIRQAIRQMRRALPKIAESA